MHDLDDVELDRWILQLLDDAGNAQPGSQGTRVPHRPSTPTGRTLIVAIVAALLIGGTIAVLAARDHRTTAFVPQESTLDSTTSTSVGRSIVDPSSLPAAPADVTRVPVPASEFTPIAMVDGLTWTADTSGADNRVCLMSETPGAGGAGPCQSDTATGTLSGFYSKINSTGVVAIVQYWLLPDPVTVSLQNARGEPLCIGGATPTPAYEGTTLWTCALGPAGPPTDAAAVFNVDGVSYVQVPPTRPYPCNRGGTYVIQAGDTPSTVANKFDTSPEVLALYNQETPGQQTPGFSAFSPGTTIQIPQVC